MKLLRLVLLSLSVMLPSHAFAEECVVLLHGLARSELSMASLASGLRDAGYRVVNHGYPSRHADIEVLAFDHIPRAMANCPDASAVHFVTHSLGGILVRRYLQEHRPAKLGRVVMLGPPHQGSEVVNALLSVPGSEYMGGPAFAELASGGRGGVSALPDVDFELGVIAGDRSWNWLLSRVIPGPDDGKVSVAATRVGGMREHLVLHTSHPFMLYRREVQAHVLCFLADGAFCARRA